MTIYCNAVGKEHWLCMEEGPHGLCTSRVDRFFKYILNKSNFLMMARLFDPSRVFLKRMATGTCVCFVRVVLCVYLALDEDSAMVEMSGHEIHFFVTISILGPFGW